MWLVAVLGRCLAGCEHYEVFCSTSEICIIIDMTPRAGWLKHGKYLISNEIIVDIWYLRM